MIDLCKIFGVEEGEEFTLDGFYNTYKVLYNRLYCIKGDEIKICDLGINIFAECEVIKLPKKKEFTDDELCILRNIDKDYKWITRDDYNGLAISNENKPQKTKKEGIRCWYSVGMVTFMFEHLFQSIQWEDEEPVFIDDYVERGVE
jgi:hypothetical protein